MDAPGMLVCFFTIWIGFAGCELVVNVKNKGGEIMLETIDANTTLDTVSLHFLTTDGTHVTQFIDFKNEVNVFRVMVLPEEELGQTSPQTMCFILRFIKNEFITPEAMSKLRQKNPSAIRHPEDDKGTEMLGMDLSIDIDRTYLISPYISKMCQHARRSTFAREADLLLLARTFNKDYNQMLHGAKLGEIDNTLACHNVSELRQECVCRFQVCIGWYPCGLKYCHGKDSTGKVVSYRCGIKTCQKCRTFDYHVLMKSECMWDIPS